MSKGERVCDGLSALLEYGSVEVCAEHGVIYAGHGFQLTESDRVRMEKLGWHWDEQVESWATFT